MNLDWAELRDIRGLDPAPWWPPTIIGWLLIAGLLLASVAVFVWSQRRRRARGRWRQEAALGLHQLQARLEDISAHEAAGELGEWLRCIAMAYRGRRVCAGLVGEAWLAWLEAHDPHGFPWRRAGRCLLEWPYAPSSPEGSSGTDLAPLIRAAESWLDRPPGGD
ncbi:MAG: DUF4381 domain-containing protein [Gammaproteobacteria bacterium]